MPSVGQIPTAHLRGMSTQPRVRAGVTAGGQFSTGARDESTASLTAPAAREERVVSPAGAAEGDHLLGANGEVLAVIADVVPHPSGPGRVVWHYEDGTASAPMRGEHETIRVSRARPTRPVEVAGPGGVWGGRRDGEVGELPITALVTTASAMTEVLTSGRRSDSPDDPVLVRARYDDPARWEVADGHHRIADAIRAGRTTVTVEFDTCFDDEPYEGHLYDFAQHLPADAPDGGAA